MNRLVTLVLLMFIPLLARADEWIATTTIQIEKAVERSRIVFILHWHPDAGDYLLELVKGFPEPKRFLPELTSWKAFTERIYADPFKTPQRPQVAFVFIEDPKPELDYYHGLTSIDVSSDIKLPISIPIAEALAHIRSLKN